MSDDRRRHCPLCGKPTMKTVPGKETCHICGGPFETDDSCSCGRPVCDGCRNNVALTRIMEICTATESGDPHAILLEIMVEPSLRMHDARHHVAVGSALLAAYKNSGGPIDDIGKALREMRKRGGSAPAGSCGFMGNCGAAVSAGAFYSIATEASPYSEGSRWGDANILTGRCLVAMGEVGGPRCCKRNSFMALETTAGFVRDRLGITMDMPGKITCGFHERSAECIERRCAYYAEGE